MAGSRVLNGNIAMSSFGQSQGSTTQVPTMMVGEKNKTVTNQGGPYNAQQSATATSDVVSVGADYGVWDYTQNQALDANSTNLKDPV